MTINTYSFAGSDNLDAIQVWLDPDGVVGNAAQTSGMSKPVAIVLYANGRIRTRGTAEVGTRIGSGGVSTGLPPNPSLDPVWFSWN